MLELISDAEKNQVKTFIHTGYNSSIIKFNQIFCLKIL